jgi:outer membrane lipoprotein-sorting protein
VNRRGFVALAALTLPLVSRVSAAQRAGAPATEPSADELVARMLAFYAGTKTFKSAFKQHFATQESLSGVVTWQKPGLMSWRYAGSGSRIVADGTSLKIYERASKQLYVRPPGAPNQCTVALSFLLEPLQLEQAFKLTKADRKPRSETRWLLQAIPRQPNPACERAILHLDPQSYQVRRVWLMDAYGSRARFDFSASKLNTKPPAGEFVLEPPPGTNIITIR